MSHAAAYRHFGDRIDLLAAIAETGLELFAAGALRLLHAHGDPGDLASLHGALARHYVGFALESPGYFRAIFHPDLGRLSAAHPLALARKRRFAELVGFFEVIRQNGELRAASAEDAALAHWAMVHGLATLVLEGQLQRSDVDARAGRISKLLESGLFRSREGRAVPSSGRRLPTRPSARPRSSSPSRTRT